MWLEASNRGRLLDVGCGSGQFLAQMRDLGWEVIGIEPDPEAVRVGQDNYGLQVYQGTLEEASFAEDSFDVVTMSHVIEHVADPIKLFKECGRVLKPGGSIVVVTPNNRSLGRWCFGSTWRGWEPPCHLFLFSPQALRDCATRAGLEIKELETRARSARFMWHVSCYMHWYSILPGGNPQEVSPFVRLSGFVFYLVEHVLTRACPVGEKIVLIATKE